jgi:shikimate kinase
MKYHNKHIILIGFKHVGKTAVGRELAACTQRDFIDLDQKIEMRYEEQYQQKKSCRQIMQQQGEIFFREIETLALRDVIYLKPSIISVGGGTSLHEENQRLIEPHNIVHVTAPRGVVFERIMLNGRPAFFSENEDPFVSFNRLWEERVKIYQRIANFSVENSGSVAAAVKEIMEQLNASLPPLPLCGRG